jgi:ribonucleotide monophosphatase NagD (HAD superfamily)
LEARTDIRLRNEALGAHAGHQIALRDERSAPSRTRYAAKLHRLGIVAEESDILTSASATASYIATHGNTDGKSAFVIGTPELKAEIDGAGLPVAEGECGRDASFVTRGIT